MRFALAFTLVIVGTVLRVLPHPWNFAPIGAIALFSGAHFERRQWGITVPLVAMFAGDTLSQLCTGHGYHKLMPAIYATYALIALVGVAIRNRRTSVVAIGGGVIASSLIFFIVTNFAVWLSHMTYPMTPAGLVACYIAALPLLGNTIASDAIYTALLFGTFALAERHLRISASAAQ